MGWEERNRHGYYYRKTRKGDQVFSEYIGSGLIADLACEVDRNEQEIRKARHEEKRAVRRTEAEIDRELATAEAAVTTITESVLYSAGFHKHKGQWRKKRHEKKTDTGKHVGFDARNRCAPAKNCAFK